MANVYIHTKLVVDMLNDFVTGALKCDRGEDYEYGLKYLKETYGAEITDVDTLLKTL